jgi:formylglycine-generating enzyme required for sulfatase activity
VRYLLRHIAAALAAFAPFAAPALAEKRVALVIGNANYTHIAKLDNPGNDARLMAETLRALGFTLVGGGPQIDLDEAGFRQAVRNFGPALQGADVALFYYAGHGVQVRGSNYLVPTAANPVSEADVDFQMMDTNMVLRQMEAAGARLNLVILDACRNNPFGGRGLRSTAPGLAQMQAPQGTLISFATQPGNVAADGKDGNSPFTKALAQAIRKPGLDIFRTFNEIGLAVASATGGAQQPWVSLSPIKGDFYFAGRGTADSAAAQAAPDVSALQERLKALEEQLRKKDEPKVAVVVPPVAPAVPADTQPKPAVGVFPKSTITVTPLSPERERSLRPKDTFKECDVCPEMVVVPTGSFSMGSPTSEKERDSDEGPQRVVTLARPFAAGKFAVTFDEWDACVADGGCNGYRPADQGWGRGRRPVISVSWDDAKAYVAWLSRRTGRTYRLLSEAEREYVARAGTTTPFWWGTSISTGQANYDGNYTYGGRKGEYRQRTLPVDSFQQNPFGLYQVHGNV